MEDQNGIPSREKQNEKEIIANLGFHLNEAFDVAGRISISDYIKILTTF